MLKPIIECHTMGVFNITPNSFSDGGKFLDRSKLTSTIDRFKKIPELIFDFGFESTAPMNRAVDSLTEKNRMIHFLDQILDVDLSHRWISIDTYQISNFLFLYGEMKKRYPTCGIILNDVSGVLDRALADGLSLMKNDPSFHYIYSSSNISDRTRVLDHMSFISSDDVFDQLNYKMDTFINWAMKNNFSIDRIILDPALGFSKTYEQNWQIIEGMRDFINDKKKYRDFIWLFGFSKKSFLQKKFSSAQDPKFESESLHSKLVNDFLTLPLRGRIFRVHDPLIVLSAPNLLKNDRFLD